MSIGKKEMGFKINVNWLITIPILAVALMFGFWFVPDVGRPMFIYATAVVAGCAGLVTALNAVEGRSSSAARERKMIALSFQRDWNNPQFYNARTTGSAVIKYFKEHHNINEQKQYLEQDAQRQSALFDVLNLFESLAISIDCELVDEAGAKRFFRSLVLGYWNTTRQWIEAIRAERDNARLYQELAWLFNRWKD